MFPDEVSRDESPGARVNSWPFGPNGRSISRKRRTQTKVGGGRREKQFVGHGSHPGKIKRRSNGWDRLCRYMALGTTVMHHVSAVFFHAGRSLVTWLEPQR